MRAELPRRGGLPIKRAREIASGTDGLWSLLWREPDSNHRSRSRERLFWASPIGDGDMKGGATYRFRSETAMLAWIGCPQPFPSRRDREFESVFLQRRVARTPITSDPGNVNNKL
jgi:hypothetical protein